ncbi:winged helix-turn-helix domain-containing protein [Oceanihabitans sp. 2_MG-2023]|uniref:winged helix-turn-helix domain-containing protein n=1 Tax=Oceanihabitans sp. 2_MG-2023 TaxID=3062661 RepID=UPI0026E33FB7|nr:winged helix-turn-helix domain-containing protein [Oceanihabitans sp. 2_MG-2023]MDO6596067.1 winged helix-turn-helix domain-containing protein [Oceanihabitans sp. 2_MG-2023]
MNTNTAYLFRSFGLLLFFISVISCNTKKKDNFSETVKVSLREVGHHLLLANQDSTTLVKPVIALSENKFQVTFENTIAIQPDSLVAIIKNSFERAKLPQHYITEVTLCNNQEVAYSYIMNYNAENNIIPCKGRELHKECYQVTVQFEDVNNSSKSKTKILYVLFLVFLVLLVLFAYRRKPKHISEEKDLNFTSLGKFQFYPKENKLIKESVEISLSKKECEILAIFVGQPNQIIKREELIKKVWEDNGVVVGRSLDTYISKLRKKLQEDETIKLTNVHGVGYKLEVVSL